MARPGIMVYFDILEPVQMLTNAERGKLLTAILEYGKEGKEPSFTGKLALAWSFVRPRIDVDGKRYDSVVEKRKYAGFCSSLARRNLETVSFEDWQEMDEGQLKALLTGADRKEQVSAHADTWEPAADTTTATIFNSSAAAAQAASPEATAAAENKKLKKINGILGQGVVYLSDDQIGQLLEKMDLDMFDYYVAKLAEFILCNGAVVKNHYATILKWWTEDCRC